MFCQEYDGVPCSWRRHDVWEHRPSSCSKDTASEDDESAHTLHVQACGVLKIIVFW